MWQATLGRTPLDVWSDSRRDLYQTTQNTHDRKTTRHPARFEPDNPRKPQTHALYSAATGIRKYRLHKLKYNLIISRNLSWILRRVRNPTEHLVQSICLLVIQHIKKRELLILIKSNIEICFETFWIDCNWHFRFDGWYRDKSNWQSIMTRHEKKCYLAIVIQ